MDEDLAANAQRLGQLLRSQLQAINSPRIEQARPWLLSATASMRPVFVETGGFPAALAWYACPKSVVTRKAHYSLQMLLCSDELHACRGEAWACYTRRLLLQASPPMLCRAKVWRAGAGQGAL